MVLLWLLDLTETKFIMESFLRFYLVSYGSLAVYYAHPPISTRLRVAQLVLVMSQFMRSLRSHLITQLAINSRQQVTPCCAALDKDSDFTQGHAQDAPVVNYADNINWNQRTACSLPKH